jgi:hypothetical protein
MRNLLIITLFIITFFYLRDKIRRKNIYDNFKILNYEKKSDIYYLPKIIFCYWHNYEEDDFIKLFVENWKKKISPDWNIIVIHKNNIKQYTKNDMDKYKGLDNTKYSDFLRLYLLKEYGGVWMDISTIIIDGKFLDNYYDEMVENKYDGLLYEFREKTVNKNYPLLENWFIIAPKNSKLINEWFYIFNQSFEMGFIEFKKNILIESGISMWNTMLLPHDIYLMMHSCLNYLMNKGQKYNICIKNACDSMFKLQNDTKWNFIKMKQLICQKKFDNIYAIKLIKRQRNYLKKQKCFINILKEL